MYFFILGNKQTPSTVAMDMVHVEENTVNQKKGIPKNFMFYP